MLVVPPLGDQSSVLVKTCGACIDLARADWDSWETSWDFTTLPLLSPKHRAETLEQTYTRLRAEWRGMMEQMWRLETESNRIFINASGLENEIKSDVPIEEITLTCNPAYRYGVKISEAEREERLLTDTVQEFLHYAVGCMFGRYSLDAPGLVLANQGERLEDYLAKVPSPSFMPDKDNVIPVLDGEWFADDITERFRQFLRITFGEEHYRENLAFIEEALGKDIRRWFTRDFFEYHVRRFKKRPIYWLFSSPKGTFSALMYMHRYRPETVSVLLNDYLRELIRKLEAHRTALEKLADDPTATPAKATKARKDVLSVSQQIDELKDWERDVVFPLAQKRIEIDLDDGVKANYPKFGAALRQIKGLEASDE
jgi:type II restriction/modification system DNA methylase subunit YeeA